MLLLLRHHGIGGIGIIRISGEKSFEILDKIFVPKNKENIENIKGYTIKYGNIVEGKKAIDEVLVSYFKAPKSYTTENMCEINSHGGNIVMKKILELCLKNGAQMAEPGEFTKRAFLNGRIDLAQAESVIDIINAKTDKEAKTGVNQLEGYLSDEIKQIKEKILDIMTNIEVSIDYPEYDIEEVENNAVLEGLEVIKDRLLKLEKSFDNGKIIKNGIKTAIIGRPNAGKSSLLNAILKEDRAIVTEYEGTTRDTIEEDISVNGIPLNIIDTAGIRETENEVEKLGIAKSREIAEGADLIIAIFDISKQLKKEDFDILNMIKDKKSIVVLNKIDLTSNILDDNINEIEKYSKNIVKISALKKIGIEDLYNKITEIFNLNQINVDNDIVITNIRHKNLISKAIESVNKSEETIKNNMPIDVVAIFLKEILENLGNITGDFVTEDIINDIFSKFCLGK